MPDRIMLSNTLPGRTVSIGRLVLVCSLLAVTPCLGSELRKTPIVRAIQHARCAVVDIRGEKTLDETALHSGQGDATRRVNGMGTGVLIDPRGYIVTNHHVVDGVRKIRVTLDDGRRLTAQLVEHDLETDLAIIKVDTPERLPVITIGTSSDLMTGETVVAVGNAYGYGHTVTRGIISALHRAVQVSDAQAYDDLIQTDASINPGNSGGPLLNIDGAMIGINVAVRAGAQGIGFAIPVDTAVDVAAKILASHNVKQTWHGVALAPDSSLPEAGLVVASVEKKSPAANCGLKSGDVLTAVDDLQIQRGLDFYRGMLNRKVGEEVCLAIRRAGEPMELSLTLAAVPQRLKAPNYPAWEVLGLELRVIPDSHFRQKYRTRYRGGLSVTAVRPNSPAADQGIRPGDVLVGMHVWETVSLENVTFILNRPDFRSLNPVKFFILRGKETLFGYLPVSTKTAQRS